MKIKNEKIIIIGGAGSGKDHLRKELIKLFTSISTLGSYIDSLADKINAAGSKRTDEEKALALALKAQAGTIADVLKDTSGSDSFNTAISKSLKAAFKGQPKPAEQYTVTKDSLPLGKPSNKKLIGVQLIDLVDKLNNYEGTFYYRKLETNKNKKKMMNIFNIVYNTEFHKFYDWLPKNWIATLLAMHNLENISDIISNPRHLDKMFCSSLVAYTYTQWKFLNKNTEWSYITPEFFANINNLDKN
jgi:hypothetical protein